MRCEVLHDDGAFERLAPAWDALSAELGAGLFLEHRWVRSWWRAYRGVDELRLFAVWEGARLVAVWPLHLRAPRSGPLKLGELRLLGDLGGTQRSLLVADALLEPAAEALAGALAEARGWDVVDAPMRGRGGDLVAAALGRRGLKAVLTDVLGRPALELPERGAWDEFVRSRRPPRGPAGAAYVLEPDARRGLETLLTLCRKEWASHKEPSPAADPQAVAFLSDIAPTLVAEGRAWVGLVMSQGAPIAADLVVQSRDAYVQLLRGVDPEHAAGAAVGDLNLGSVRQAVERGGHRFAFAVDAEGEAPFGARRLRGQRLRAWNVTALGRLHRGVSSLRGVVKADEAPGRDRWEELRGRLRDRLRERAPEVVQRAVARVASYVTLHLYRGELFTRSLKEPPELTLSLFSRADFEALDDAAREQLIARLELVPGYCRQKWDRGDMVVLARVAGRPAGILWCARTAVYVPDIAREVRPQPGECYIHDVYVHPAERGRHVAPAMLDFLARELRSRDVYRAWALIERSNTASVRAFEKAAYAAVADVVYARMGLASRLSVRPPDPEARALLGLV